VFSVFVSGSFTPWRSQCNRHPVSLGFQIHPPSGHELCCTAAAPQRHAEVLPVLAMHAQVVPSAASTRANNRRIDGWPRGFMMLHVALDNAIECEVSNQPEQQLYWLRCAKFAQDELRRGS
jgi:hypothetical protein